MALTFTLYERARVHPLDISFYVMVFGGVQPCPFVENCGFYLMVCDVFFGGHFFKT